MGLSRANLPQNYFDWASAKLLVQPEPQYLLASFFLSAIGSSLPIPGNFGLDGRQMPTSGAQYISVDRDRLQLAEALPASLFALNVDFSKQAGQTIRVNRPKFSDTTYTAASRKLASGATISTTAIEVGLEQTHLVLERYAGPYDSTNTRVAPFAIEAFDANMGILSAPSIIGTNLARDFHKFLDSVMVTVGDIGTATYPDGMSADNDATATGSFPMTVEQIMRTEQLMTDAKLPKLPDGKRVMLITPTQWKQLQMDPDFQANSVFHQEFNILFGAMGYVKTVCGFHLFVCQTLTTSNNSSSVAIHRAIAMAPGGWMAGMGRAPQVRTSTDDNYGETVKVIWLADLAFGASDSRFFYSVRSSA